MNQHKVGPDFENILCQFPALTGPEVSILMLSLVSFGA